MMRRVQRPFSLMGADGALIGTVRAVMSHNSASERAEDDLSCAAEKVTAVVPSRYTPAGGFSRGMLLVKGSARYRVLVPIDLGGLWRLRCERIHFESEANG